MARKFVAQRRADPPSAADVAAELERIAGSGVEDLCAIWRERIGGHRYYVSQALLQNRKETAGSVARASAPDVEQAVCDAIRRTHPADDSTDDRDLIDRHLVKAVVRTRAVDVTINAMPESEADEAGPVSGDAGKSMTTTTTMTIPFVQMSRRAKGIARSPSGDALIDEHSRETLLRAIARARTWMDGILDGTIASFEAIAANEKLNERYVRRLAVLSCLSPKIVRSIADGVAPAGLTVSNMTEALPHEWAAQERQFGFPSK